MDEPASGEGRSRGTVERLALAALGAVAFPVARAEELADALVERGAMRRDEARELAEELGSRWRGDAVRASERAGLNLARLFRELGLVTRDEYEEVELRVAQLEHRLRLLEGAATPGGTPVSGHGSVEQREAAPRVEPPPPGS